AMPTAFLTESAAAAAIGLINSVGNLGGFAGPFALGYLKDKTGAHSAGMAVLATSLLLAGALALAIKPAKQPSSSTLRSLSVRSHKPFMSGNASVYICRLFLPGDSAWER